MRILTPAFLIGAFLLFYFAFDRYQPVADLWPLIILFVAGFAVLAMVLRDGRNEPVAARSLAAAALPWVGVAFFAANGALDRSDETRYQTAVVGVHYSIRMPGDELTVRSWRDGRTEESFFLNHFRSRFDVGASHRRSIRTPRAGTSARRAASL